MIAIVNALLFAAGILEAFLSFGIIGCGIALVIFQSRLYPISHAIWTGAFFFVTAIPALTAAVTGRRLVYVIHILTAVLSSVCVAPCLIGLLVIEMISDSWYSFWTDPNWCQGGCYINGGEYIRVNYGSLWTTVYSNEYMVQCASAQWNSGCHPNSRAVTCEIGAIVLTAVLALLFLASVTLCCIYVRYMAGRETVHPESQDKVDKESTPYASPVQAHPSNHNLYTSWNIPQYNTVPADPSPIYTVNPSQNPTKIPADVTHNMMKN